MLLAYIHIHTLYLFVFSYRNIYRRKRSRNIRFSKNRANQPFSLIDIRPSMYDICRTQQKIQRLHSCKTCLKNMSSALPPPHVNATLPRLSSWFIDKMPPTFYGLWTTRHSVENGMETSWLPTGGEAQSPPSALSVGRFCPIRGHAPHPI